MHFTWAIKADPKQPAFYENRGAAYLAMKRPEDAAADFTKAIELAPTG